MDELIVFIFNEHAGLASHGGMHRIARQLVNLFRPHSQRSGHLLRAVCYPFVDPKDFHCRRNAEPQPGSRRPGDR